VEPEGTVCCYNWLIHIEREMLESKLLESSMKSSTANTRTGSTVCSKVLRIQRVRSVFSSQQYKASPSSSPTFHHFPALPPVTATFACLKKGCSTKVCLLKHIILHVKPAFNVCATQEAIPQRQFRGVPLRNHFPGTFS
jgi:hypothetical protein